MNRLFIKLITGLCLLGLPGCDLSTTNSPPPDNSSSIPLAGQVSSQAFVFSSGFASAADATNYKLTLWGANAVSGTTTYPNITFNLKKANPAQTYAVTTFGTTSGSTPGIAIVGWTAAGAGVLFDSGSLVITAIDLNSNSISGYFARAATNEKTSSLSGKFSVPIQ